MIGKLKKIKKKGDVTFYQDERGVLYQKVCNNEPYKVKDGKMTYTIIIKVNGYTIKYNDNGVNGFGIFKGTTCLEDGYWVYDKVLRVVNEM